VAAEAEQVHLCADCLPAYAASLAFISPPSYDAEHHFAGSPEATLAYILTLDAVNFGSGYFPHLQKRPGMSGYFTVATALKEHFERHGPLSAEELGKLTPRDCGRLFGQDFDDEVRLELMRLYAQALNDLGDYLLGDFGGEFTALIAAAERSAARLLELLAEMPYFQDVARYHGFSAPFYKRAQITASDLALAFGGEGYGEFHDLDDLTVFADNLVPHVLHLDGVLDYAPALAARIDAGVLPAGSAEEVEIRAVALHAVELLVQTFSEQGRHVSARALDYLLWNRGQEPRYKEKPRHRTRTVFY
jgi:hypothetical protein